MSGIDNFPGNVTTPADKLEYAYRCQELLRLLHNDFVDWRENVWKPEKWGQTVPAGLKVDYPFVAQISLATWRRFMREEWLPRSETVQEEILKHRDTVLGNPDADNEAENNAYGQAKAAMMISNRWQIDVGLLNKLIRM